MSVFANLIRVIQQYGVLNFYLPFLLTFSVFYGLLQKTKIFGVGREVKSINAVIAVVAAFYVIAYTPVGIRIGEFLATFFTQTTLVLVTLVGASLILGIAGKDILWVPEKWYGKFFITLILVLIGVVIFFSSGGPQIFGFDRIPTFGLTTDDIFFLFLMGITLAIIIGIPFAGKKEEVEQPQQRE